jgi:hypothetical protein
VTDGPRAVRSGPASREDAGPDPGVTVRVRVIEHISEPLAGVAQCRYESPPHPREQALALVRVLLGVVPDPTGSRWRRPIAGGHRSIQLIGGAPR